MSDIYLWVWKIGKNFSMSQFVGKLWDRFRRALGGIVEGEDSDNNCDGSKGGARTLDFVQSAIYNLRGRNGSSFEDILDYLCSQYEVDEETVRGRVLTALRRGVSIGVLEQEGSLYRLTKCREKKAHRWRKDSQNSTNECTNCKPNSTEGYQNDEGVDDIDALDLEDNY